MTARRGLVLLAPVLAAAVALVLAGRAAVADGFGAVTAPGTGYTATTTTVDGGSYSVQTSDAVVRFNTTDAGASASLPSPSYVGERHQGAWVGWTAAQSVPVVNVGTSGTLILLADSGLVDAATVTPIGASKTFTWTGSEWAAQ